MVVHRQDDLLGFVSEIIVSIEEVEACILSLCLLNINLGIFNQEMVGQRISLSEIFVNYIKLKYFHQNKIFPTKLKYFINFKIVSDLLRCPGKSRDRGVSRGFQTDGNVFSFYHSEIALGGVELWAN